MSDTNWDDPKSKLSPHFTVHDATWLPSWQVYHQPSDEEKEAILRTAEKLEKVREVLGKPLNVHCWIRPDKVICRGAYNGRNYNAHVGGAKKSAHRLGLACDFNPIGMTCGDAKELLNPKLEELDVRMEDNGTGNWVHIDLVKPAPGRPRFFKP